VVSLYARTRAAADRDLSRFRSLRFRAAEALTNDITSVKDYAPDPACVKGGSPAPITCQEGDA